MYTIFLKDNVNTGIWSKVSFKIFNVPDKMISLRIVPYEDLHT